MSFSSNGTSSHVCNLLTGKIILLGLWDYDAVLSRNPILEIGESLVKVKSITKVRSFYGLSSNFT